MNVRWDAVIDHRMIANLDEVPPPSPQCMLSVPGVGEIGVHVQLFGALASSSAERSIQLEVPCSATVADVLAALGSRLGESFLSRVLDRAGAKHRHCRLFIDGYAVEDLNFALPATGTPTQIEIILLVAPEGG
jgi:hypothetical protein